jgi:hypothetical protein
MTLLAEWKDFYVIVGSAAAVLIGLQFIVMTLIPALELETAADVSSALSTPTVVHFCSVLLLAAIAAAPWEGYERVAVVLFVITGVAGLAYMAFVLSRFRRQNDYAPVFEDWLFHILVPIVSYVVLAISAFAALGYERAGLFGVALAVLALLFTGIHNVWDSIVYLVFVRKNEVKSEGPNTDAD